MKIRKVLFLEGVLLKTLIYDILFETKNQELPGLILSSI